VTVQKYDVVVAVAATTRVSADEAATVAARRGIIVSAG
jgi:hypothetical protein